MGSNFLFQGIFPTQGSNPGLPHCWQILYQLSHQGSPRTLEWVAYPCSRGSSRPRNWTRVSCIAGGFFTNLGYQESESEVTQSCPTLCDPKDCSLPGSSAHGIFQARVLEWVAISFSRGSSQPTDRTQVSHIVGRRFTVWATREAPQFRGETMNSFFNTLFTSPNKWENIIAIKANRGGSFQKGTLRTFENLVPQGSKENISKIGQNQVFQNSGN